MRDNIHQKPVARLAAGWPWAVLVLAGGCTVPLAPNKRLETYSPDAGYRFNTLDKGEGNSDEVLICLCFSGGGTRAAALSYGVLEALRATTVKGPVPDGSPRPLLAEVDVISSVSGGSFTAMKYGLDRDGAFDGEYEKGFLKRNIQGRLIGTFLRPMNLLRMPLAIFDRIDLAARYYNNEVFDNRTYSALVERGTRPFIVVNATNMAMGDRFEFTQDDFDVLGSDISQLPVGQAVAASSAFPMLFSPMRLKYFEHASGPEVVRRLGGDAAAERKDIRRYLWAQSLMPPVEDGQNPQYEIDYDNHKYLYLLDGGVTDNLGTAYVIQQLRFGELHDMIDVGKVKKFVVIVVDASVDAPEEIEHQANAPGFFLMALKSGTTSIYNYSQAMTRVLRFMLIEDPQRLCKLHDACCDRIHADCPDAEVPQRPAGLQTEYHYVDVNFRRLRSRKERDHFLSTPTTLFLSAGRVDELIGVGGRLLVQDESFRKLVADLGGELPEFCAECSRPHGRGDVCRYCNPRALGDSRK